MSTYTWDAVEPVRRDRIEEGERSMARIDTNARKTFDDWLRVGEALDDMQQAIMTLAGTNQPVGKGYNAAFKVIAERVPKLASIDKSVRVKAIWMHANREAVEAWHAGLPAAKKRLVNHPATVKRLFEKAGQEPKARKAAQGDLTEAASRIETITDKLELGKEAANWYDLSEERVTESAANFIEIHAASYSLEAVREFAYALTDAVRERLPPRPIPRRGTGVPAVAPPAEPVEAKAKRASPKKYPFEDLAVGEAFVEYERTQSAMSARAGIIGKKLGRKYTTKIVEGGVQVMRTA